MFEQLIAESDSFQPDYESVEIEVDYRKPFEELVKEMGVSFVQANFFPENNPLQTSAKGVRRLNFVSIGHKRWVNSHKVLDDMLSHYILPVDIREFLFFCRTIKQIHHFYAALGSKTTSFPSRNGESSVPMLCPDGMLLVNQESGVWPPYTRFVGIQFLSLVED